MKKEIRKTETCETCGRTVRGTIYEVYCDKCGKLIERGETYGGKSIGYTKWNKNVAKFDDSRTKFDFCSYRCMTKSMASEDLPEGTYISISLYINSENRKDIMDAFRS